MTSLRRPALEGTVAVRAGRRLGFAEYGSTHGPALIWMHGTPGARRQIPVEAREHAAARGIRLIGIDRPGIGSSTTHLYPSIVDWTRDLEIFADTLGIDTMHLVGLSGGGPYVLAAAHALRDRVHAVGVLGGVAPTVGPEAAEGGLVQFAVRMAPLIAAGRIPISVAVTQAVRVVRPLGGPILDLYAALQPTGDKALLSRPEFKAMFLDDLLNGARFQSSAPLNDMLLFTRDWGFRASEIDVPVHWWHGDADHIVPFAHGAHVVELIDGASMTVIDGESHLGGLGIAHEVIESVMAGFVESAGLRGQHG